MTEVIFSGVQNKERLATKNARSRLDRAIIIGRAVGDEVTDHSDLSK